MKSPIYGYWTGLAVAGLIAAGIAPAAAWAHGKLETSVHAPGSTAR